MRKRILFSVAALAFFAGNSDLFAGKEIMKKHCAECHNDEKTKGKFNLRFLVDGPTQDNLEYWIECLDLVTAEEMPPEDDSHLSMPDRELLAKYLDEKILSFDAATQLSRKTPPRRLNNREFANSVRDALLIEDVGTHQPTANLIGDTLHQGFDTHSDTLGFSRFHLEQYLEAVRKIVDAAILSGEKPESRRYEISAERIERQQLNQNSSRPIQRGKNGVFDFLDPRLYGYFADFKTAPESGRYKIRIRATGKDRLTYDSKYTGVYEGDALRLSVHLGDRIRTFNLPDEEVLEIEMDEWIAAGTRLELHNAIDGLLERGNGNFKFQNGIVPDHLKENHPKRYAELVEKITNSNKRSRKGLGHWSNWTEYWEGPRPQVFSAEIEGPFYESWPPKRQVALIGEKPTVKKAAEILEPIAERAWRRPVREGELDDIVALVNARAETMNDIEALKEGIVAVFVSPAFLLLNTEDRDAADRFASKLSYFLQSTLPGPEFRESVEGGELGSFEAVRDEVQQQFDEAKAEEFIKEFPYAWMKLNDINFMAPDPDQYRFYHRKRVSEDMVAEVLHFFRYAIENNIPIPEFLSADYSFINADLARIYGVEIVPRDSKLRKYTFTDGRRGGLLGMAAFLTATADSLSTSPIHRAIYVMENFMGIHPTPPPPNVVIKEPDVRQAKTIKEVLAAHVSDKNCASCHTSIDPWGYAFESFDPTGAWRDAYTIPVAVVSADEEANLPAEVLWRNTTIPVDASARFRSGGEYQDIIGYRKQLLTDANRDRFVRCFITKLLTYANGVEPSDIDFVQVEKILSKSKDNDYRIVDTIAAVIDSPLFRE